MQGSALSAGANGSLPHFPPPQQQPLGSCHHLLTFGSSACPQHQNILQKFQVNKAAAAIFNMTLLNAIFQNFTVKLFGMMAAFIVVRRVWTGMAQH